MKDNLKNIKHMQGKKKLTGLHHSPALCYVGDRVILHLCADIGSDSKPYADAGYDVRLIGSDIGIQNYRPPKNVYGIIANPPCTNFSFAKTTGEPRNLHEGMVLVRECLRIIWECQYDLEGAYSKKTSLFFWMLENPNGLLKRFLGKPAFKYHPWEFGDNYKKSTHIWGWFNDPLKTFSDCNDVMTPNEIEQAKTNSRKLPKFDRLKTREIHYNGNEHLTRQARRSICSPGFAKAFFKANR